MPFGPDPFLERFEPLRRIRRRAWLGYGAAVGGVGLAMFLRFLVKGYASPFVIFYPFVIVATFIGGWRAGALSTVLSALAADYFFISPPFNFYVTPRDPLTFVIFGIACLAIVALVTLLNVAIDRLARQAANVRFLLEAEPAGMIVTDVRGRIQYVNAMAERLLGYAREELNGAPIETLVPDDARDRHVGLRTGFMARPSARTMGAGRDLYARRKDGVLQPVEVGLVPFECEGRTGALATIIDISERKRAEEDLRRSMSEQRLLAQLGASVAGTMDFDETLTIIAQLFSRDVADLCIIDLLDNGSFRRARVACRDVSKKALCDTLMRPPPAGEQIRIARPEIASGKLILIQKLTADVIGSWARGTEERAVLQNAQSAIVAPLSARGKLTGVLSLLSFSRVFGKQDLRIVETASQEAALLLDNARLFGAAKQATQARDNMLGVVAHDLRNPLAAITTLGEVLKRGPEHEVGDEIKIASSRMRRLIQDLIDVSRLEAGPLPLKQAALSSSEVLSDVRASQALLASTASLEFRLDVAPNLPDLWADRDRLLQVFENLIGNATKFTKPGGHIALAAKAGPNEVQFSVADTGCGIEREQLSHVFDRFWQTPEAKRAGLGLGLPIVKGIIEAHGGRVWVQSVPGQGSTFFFTIPTASAQTALSRAVH